jgi:serine/threonine protein kinase
MRHGLPRNEDSEAPNLAGRYRLIAELGQGGMATVYLAVAMGTSGFRKLAVVKLLRPEIAVDQEFVQMFLDEARLCARLSHPNIVQTYDVGVDEVGHLMAMEYLDGVSLHAATAKLARNDGPLTFPLQARILLEVVEGLRYAHELKDYDGRSLDIVHRDVTPHNIFITYDGQVKLLDFGIAKAATSSVRTATGVIKGKLTYMAPTSTPSG